MATFRVPPLLAETAAREPGMGAWIAGLPAIVAELSAEWRLRVRTPFRPGGHCAWVAPATDAAGRARVLKLAFRFPSAEERDEAAGLRTWAGNGAVRLHAARELESTCALLLERCAPGTPLRARLAGPDQDEVVAGLLRRLWAQPYQAARFRPLGQMCAEWADGFEAGYAAAAGDKLDAGIAAAGIGLFRTLPQTADREALLCTDLHAANILAARRAPWLVIDPKPYVGDPAYDVLQHMLNCRTRLAADPAGLAARMAGLTGLDAGRVRRWLLARCVQESLHDPLMRRAARRLARD